MRGSDDGSKKSFLTMPQLSQLGVVVGRYKLDTLRLLRTDDSSPLSSSDIARQFQANSSAYGLTLILVQGRIKKSPSLLTCALKSPPKPLPPGTRIWIENKQLFAAASDKDYIVQLLPTHRVLRSTSEYA